MKNFRSILMMQKEIASSVIEPVPLVMGDWRPNHLTMGSFIVLEIFQF
jgi:hypothetical protein